MKHLLSSSAFLIVNKKLAFILGLKTTVYLADLISKENYFIENGTIKDGWFFNTETNIEEDTTLSPYQQRKAIKDLKENSLIETKRIGIPAKMHFKINEEQVMKFLNNLKLSKCTTINKNKEIRITNKPLFIDEVFSFDYPKEMLQDFYDYWSEPSKKGKLRKDMQKTWCTARRLKAWSKRSKQFNTKTSKIDQHLSNHKKAIDIIKNTNYES